MNRLFKGGPGVTAARERLEREFGYASPHGRWHFSMTGVQFDALLTRGDWEEVAAIRCILQEQIVSCEAQLGSVREPCVQRSRLLSARGHYQEKRRKASLWLDAHSKLAQVQELESALRHLRNVNATLRVQNASLTQGGASRRPRPASLLLREEWGRVSA